MFYTTSSSSPNIEFLMRTTPSTKAMILLAENIGGKVYLQFGVAMSEPKHSAAVAHLCTVRTAVLEKQPRCAKHSYLQSRTALVPSTTSVLSFLMKS